MMKLIIGIMIFASIGLAAMLIWYAYLRKQYSKNTRLYEKDKVKVVNKKSVSDNSDRFFQMIYNGFVKIPVIKYYLKKTRLKLEMTNDYTEYEIRKQSAKNLFIALIVMFASMLILVNLVDDLYMSLILIIGVLIVTEKIIDMRITSVSSRILRQMQEAFTNIRHAFHEHGMIEESFEAAIDELGEKDIVPQLKRIKEAMIAEDPETELERYYDTAPNRFLKLFAGVSYLTLELGDRKVNETSVYLKNLNNILSDAYLEILKQDKINYHFRSLTVIAVCPIIFIKPLQSWAESNFPSLTNFYASTTGFVIQSLILISIFVCYLFLRILKEDSEQIKFDRVAAVRWQDKLYRIEFIKILVDAFKPKKHTSKRRKIENLIKSNNAYLTLEWLYVNKLTTFTITFIVVLFLMVNLQFININAIYNSISDEFLSFGTLSEEQMKAANALNNADKEIINKYSNSVKSREELSAAVASDSSIKLTDSDIDRIYGKIESLDNVYFKAWHFLVALVCALIGYLVPTGVLMFKEKIRAMEKENEIMQFQSIILMLMYIERVDVQTILEWLARFSYAFKEPISTCLNNYEAGAYEALEELKDSVPHKDFVRIVEQLQSAVERIPIRAAFDELETEREYYYEKRKQSNEALIQKKVTIGKVLGFTPMVLLIGGYLVGPLLIVSIMQMMSYFTEML